MSRKLVRPTPEEDAAINAGIAADPDTHVLSDEEFQDAVAQFKARGRPLAAQRKQPVTLRLDREVVDALRATGPGWQTRLNAELRKRLLRNRR